MSSPMHQTPVSLANPQACQFSCSMFIKTRNGIYTWASDELLKRHEINLREVVGKTDSDLPWSSHFRTLRYNDQEVLDSQKAIVFEETISRGGRSVRGLCQKSPVHDDRGWVVGISGVFMDLPVKECPPLSQLNIRETQVLKNLSSGMSASKSAQKLGLSQRTVEGYLEQVRFKLNCKSQAELLAFYFQQGQYQTVEKTRKTTLTPGKYSR